MTRERGAVYKDTDIFVLMGKLRGRVLWLEPVKGRVVDEGVIDRAILRHDRLVMDITANSGVYAVELLQNKVLEFDGSWTCPRGKRSFKGVADCALREKNDYFLLFGDWDRGRRDWYARLFKLETS